MFFPLNVEVSLDKKVFGIKVKDCSTDIETTFVGKTPRECIDKLNDYIVDYFSILCDCDDTEKEEDCYQIY